ncbi:MAG TPA: hypothetical protein VGC92_10050 [Phenylobacterium sp.]|jgi:hypothetical protein
MTDTTSSVIYNHETVALDGQTFSDCEFRESRLVYSGGEVPTFANCRFDDCEWKFEDGAAHTLSYLQTLWSLGQKPTVQALIKDVTGSR